VVEPDKAEFVLELQRIGRRVHALRRMQGLTQEQLAEGVGISRTQITNIESGRSAMSIRSLFYIANVMKLTPNDIILNEPVEGLEPYLKAIGLRRQANHLRQRAEEIERGLVIPARKKT
jgi:transcriptional regulator with XRE-family HTH domain